MYRLFKFLIKEVDNAAMKKLFLVVFNIMFLLVNSAKAEAIICSDRDVGIARSAFVTAAGAESWFPLYIYVSDVQVKFGDNRYSWFLVDKNRGDDIINSALAWDGTLYKMRYKKSKNTLSVKVVGDGAYKVIPPITYKNCEQLGSKSSSSNVSDNAAKAAYIKLSKCNRRYIQQFLSGQGLYKSTIDGKWGAGTASALEKAKKLGKLKGKSSAQIIQQLSQNLVCD